MILRGTHLSDIGGAEALGVAAAPSGPTLDDLFRRAAVHDSSAVALRDAPNRSSFTDGAPRRLTYAEADRAISTLAARLCRAGLQADTLVAIQLPNTPEFLIAHLAINRLGAVMCTVHMPYRGAEIETILAHSGAKLFFTSAYPFSELLGAAPLAREHPAPDARDAFLLLYTSGTTGEPKGVVLSHSNILANVLAVKDIVRATIERPEEHRTLSFLPWAHAFGHTVELHGLISSGASLAIAESIDKVIDNIREVKPTVLVAVPTVFVRIQAGVEKMIAERSSFVRWLFRAGLEQAKMRRSGRPLSGRGKLVLKSADRLIFSKIRARFGGRLSFAICGAAALPRETGEFVDSIGIDVFEGYGLTECSPIVSTNTPQARKLGSAGRPLPGVRVVIEKSSNDGESPSGEIIVYGASVMRGYHRRDDENRRVLTPDGGLRTGDLGYLDSDGFLFVTGRIKEQYKLLNAKYVAPAQLEEQLKLSPWIESVMVYGDNRPYNVALIVPNEKALHEFGESAGLGAQGHAGLLEHPRVKLLLSREIERLSLDFKGYERIRDFAFVPEPFTQQNGLLTPSLKLRRAEILKRWGSLLDGLYANAPAVSSEERLLQRM